MQWMIRLRTGDIIAVMPSTADHRILDEMLDPVGECLTPDVAARIAALRADAQTQRRVDKLAEKNAEGTLSPGEEAQYAAYVEALDVIAILQAKARKALKHVGNGKRPARCARPSGHEHVIGVNIAVFIRMMLRSCATRSNT